MTPTLAERRSLHLDAIDEQTFADILVSSAQWAFCLLPQETLSERSDEGDLDKQTDY